MSFLNERLKLLEYQIRSDPESLINRLISNEYIISDELDSILNLIVKTAFDAGRKNYDAERKAGKVDAAKAGWTKRIVDSSLQAKELTPLIQDFRRNGIHTLQAIADELNDREIKTVSGHQWYPSTVRLLIGRIKEVSDKRTPS